MALWALLGWAERLPAVISLQESQNIGTSESYPSLAISDLACLCLSHLHMWAIISGPSQVKTDRRGGKSLKQTQEQENHFHLWQRVRLEDYCRGIWLHVLPGIWQLPGQKGRDLPPCAGELGIWPATHLPHYAGTNKLARRDYFSRSELTKWAREVCSSSERGASEGSILYWSWDLKLNPCRVACEAARQCQRSGQQSGCGVKYASQRVHLLIITLAMEITWHISLPSFFSSNLSQHFLFSLSQSWVLHDYADVLWLLLPHMPNFATIGKPHSQSMNSRPLSQTHLHGHKQRSDS